MRDASVREGKPGWFASFLGAAVLIAGGFGLGLVAGVVSEEPELVVGHLVGRSEEVAWLPDAEPELVSRDGEGAVLEAETVLIGEVNGRGQPQPVLPAVAAPPPERRPSGNDQDRDSGRSPSTPAAVRAGYSVQVGAFVEGGAAENVRQQLRSKGFASYVIAAKHSRDGRWRVRVGPVPSKAAAEKLASRLKTEERLPTWVVTEGGG